MDREILETLKKLDYFSMLKILNILNGITKLNSDEFECFSLIINKKVSNFLNAKENKID